MRSGNRLRGQISTELLVVVSVVLVIFLPLLVMVYFQANEASAKLGSHQAELAVFRLAYLANSVGSLGTDTSITTDIFIPDGVTEIRMQRVGNGGEIIFKVQTPAGESEIVEVVKYPINTTDPQGDTFPVQQGWARFTITSKYNGEAQIKFTSSRQ